MSNYFPGWEGLRSQTRDPWAGLYAHATAAFDQRTFRFRNDDGSETTATWKEAENTSVTQAIGEVFRLRIEVQETGGGSANNQTLVLQSNINNEGWFDVGPTSSRVKLGNSSHVADAEPTTNQLTGGTGNFITGEIITATSGTDISFVGNDHTEVEWSSLLITGEVPDGASVQFRCTINGALPGTTSSGVPTVTAVQSPPTDAPALSIVNVTDNTIELSWTADPDAATYELQRDSVTIQNTTETTRIDTGLSSSTMYTYRVRSVNSAGVGPWSEERVVATDAASEEFLGDAVLSGEATVSIVSAVSLQGQAALHGEAAASIVSTVLVSGQSTEPDEDVLIDGFVTETGATTTLYESINEASPDDVDFIQTSPSGAGTFVYEAGLANLPQPITRDNHNLRYRIGSVGTGDTRVDVQLREGATTIASWSHSNVTTTSTFSQLLAPEESNAITSYGDLRVRFEVYVGSAAAPAASLISESGDPILTENGESINA